MAARLPEAEEGAAATTLTRVRITRSPITTTMTTHQEEEEEVENTTNTNNLRVARKPKLNHGEEKEYMYNTQVLLM